LSNLRKRFKTRTEGDIFVRTKTTTKFPPKLWRHLTINFKLMQTIKKAISCSEKRRKLHENRLINTEDTPTSTNAVRLRAAPTAVSVTNKLEIKCIADERQCNTGRKRRCTAVHKPYRNCLIFANVATGCANNGGKSWQILPKISGFKFVPSRCNR